MNFVLEYILKGVKYIEIEKLGAGDRLCNTPIKKLIQKLESKHIHFTVSTK